MLVDVHAHMDFEEYMEKKIDIVAIMDKCKEKNVVAIVSQGVDIASNRKVLELAKKYPQIKVALGIYPVHCYEMIREGKRKDFDDEIKFIDKQLHDKKAIAVGEVGLEYKEVEPTEENKKIMKDSLKKFIELSKKYNVPIILHSRGAELELIEFLEQEDMIGRKVIMHCFSGRKHHVERIKNNKWFLTIPANVVRLEHFQYITKNVPISQLLTETDSPYLSPEPGTINDSSNVSYAIKKIAEIKGMATEEVENIIYNNYQRLFL